MNTLIIPCAGKSNRFPNMKPKWLLTHPDGKLMIEKAISGLNIDIFDRIIITIVKPHCEDYEADIILNQVFNNNKKIELCILDNFTSSASETIHLTIKKMNVIGSLTVKDSDNMVKVNLSKNITNTITGLNIQKYPYITNIPGKSFLIVNKQNIIQDIIEKQVVSNIICLGVYSFEDTKIFEEGYENLIKSNIKGEMYISHVISYLISTNKYTYEYIEAKDYEDWGTLKEWNEVQKKFRTYFVDVDGVLLRNRGKYGTKNWTNTVEPIEENINTIKNLQKEGAQIVITTSRTKEYKKGLCAILKEYGIKPYAILTGMNHSSRVVINDFAPTNPYPSGIAITIPRNFSIKDYLI